MPDIPVILYPMKRLQVITAQLAAAALLCGCATAYYGAMEKVGIHKREILVDRVKEARDSQADAKEEFKDALEQFSAVVNFDGGNLEKKYKKLSSAFERSEEEAQEVRDRIDKIESVANALFREWRGELKEYTNKDLRDSSKRQYEATRDRYEVMIDTMRDAALRMNPVLDAFRDQVLFLKHNLNSRAIASIENEAQEIEKDVARLIKEMEASIAEADAFIRDVGIQ